MIEGLKVNIDWAFLKSENEVFPEVHQHFHDIHIPTFSEGMFISSAADKLLVKTPFDAKKRYWFLYKTYKCFCFKN